MKSKSLKSSSHLASSSELIELRTRLADAEEALRAIRAGEVDTVVVTGKQGPQVFTLEGAEHAYRILIESMNEGALTLTKDATILYANHCFARMIEHPLEQVLGSSFNRLLSTSDQTALNQLLKRKTHSGSKIQVILLTGNGSKTPAQISLRSLAKQNSDRATFGMVVTDMTEARRNEEMLRALTHRVVQVQETERARVAYELHDGITQLLCAILFHSQALVENLSSRDGPAKKEALKLREITGKTTDEVERISRNLRPGVLDELGLLATLKDTSTDFENRTGIPVKLVCPPLSTRLPVDTELALYRILQEALRNVEKYARAHQVKVRLTKMSNAVHLEIQDNGIGFDPNHPSSKRKGKGGLGLLSMRERATHLGGEFTLKSIPRAGTKIEIRIPLIKPL